MEFYDRSDVLCHHGIKGMKWGVRRTEAQLGRARGGKKVPAKKKPEVKDRDSEKKRTSEMSDEELARAIRRLEMERRYSDLANPKPVQKQKLFNGKKFVVDVLEQSGKQVATQAATYFLGAAVNRVVGKDVVNIKNLSEKKDKKDDDDKSSDKKTDDKKDKKDKKDD